MKKKMAILCSKLAFECIGIDKVNKFIERFVNRDFGTLTMVDLTENIKTLESNTGMLIGRYESKDKEDIIIIQSSINENVLIIVIPREI